MKYLAVSHTYHVHHIAWTVKQLAASTRPEADMLAAVQNDSLNKPYRRTDTTIIEIADEECLPPKDFKLTLRQRITGRF